MDQARVDEKVKKDEGGVWETIKVIFQALLIAVVVRTVLFQPFNIPSGSFGPPLFQGRIWGSEPKRGDIAVFKLPKDNSTDYIKRVIGLPGDRIQVVDGILQINGTPVKRERIQDYQTQDPFGHDCCAA